MEEETRYCDCCGSELDSDEGTWVNDDLLCDSCVDEHCITCACCGESVWQNQAVEDEDTSLCQECFDEHYYRCECCDRIIYHINTNWRNNQTYCNFCFDELADEIEEYSYKPEAVFFGDGSLFMGVELEVDEGGKDNDNAGTLKEIANSSNNHIYIKSDGSLDDGFEIVSHPMTLAYHMYHMDWEDVLKEAVSMGYRSHQTSTCGLHVHVNRNAFGSNQAEQEEVIAKILYFVEAHWNELFRFSRRSHYNMDRWAARYGFEKTGRKILEKAKGSYTSRYVAVNLKNYYTIEFRLFRGTLKYNTFIATLQMVQKICDVALSMSQEELENLSWSEFVSNITEPQLIQYLKERRLYVNEKIIETEEM